MLYEKLFLLPSLFLVNYFDKFRCYFAECLLFLLMVILSSIDIFCDFSILHYSVLISLACFRSNGVLCLLFIHKCSPPCMLSLCCRFFLFVLAFYQLFHEEFSSRLFLSEKRLSVLFCVDDHYDAVVLGVLIIMILRTGLFILDLTSIAICLLCHIVSFKHPDIFIAFLLCCLTSLISSLWR